MCHVQRVLSKAIIGKKYGRDTDSALYHYKTPFTHINNQPVPGDLLRPQLYYLSLNQIREFHSSGVLVISGDVWSCDAKN